MIHYGSLTAISIKKNRRCFYDYLTFYNSAMDILLVGAWPLMADDKIYGAMDEQDREFVKEAAMGGLKEIQSGKIVAERLTNSDVKQFGQKMVDEHSKANPKLQQVAAQKVIQLPQKLDEDHREIVDKLNKTSALNAIESTSATC